MLPNKKTVVVLARLPAGLHHKKKSQMSEVIIWFLFSLVPSHEQALQQIVSLKKELSELRAKLASQEEDYHKSEGEMHAEVRLFVCLLLPWTDGSQTSVNSD